MTEEEIAIILMFVFGIIALLYSVGQFINLKKHQGQIGHAIGIIIDTQTVAPETMRINNSKWAKVSYQIGGREYISTNWVQVSMNASLGDEVEISYYKNDPSKLFLSKNSQFIIFLIIAAGCIIAGLIILHISKFQY